MTWSFRIVWIGGLVMATTVAASAEPTIRVRLYDYAGVSPTTLDRAKASASQVLDSAGVRLIWIECRLRQADPPKDSACELPLTALDLHLRILDAGIAKSLPTTRHCLGYALLADGFYSIAAVYFDRALELEKQNLANRAAILGAMMAHEVGHLLLEQSGHSGRGIMRARWGHEDLKMIAKGRLCLTAEEASRLNSMLAKRQQAGRRN